MSKKQDDRKKRKKEEARKEKLAQERARFARPTTSRDDRFADNVMELVRAGLYQEATDELIPYVEKNPKLSGPLGILVVAAEGCEDYATMFWAADRLISVNPVTREDIVLYFNACAKNQMIMSTFHAAQITLPFAHAIGGTEGIEKQLADLPNALSETREIVRIDSPELAQTLDDEELWEMLRYQEQATLYLRYSKYTWLYPICEHLIKRYPQSSFPFSIKALATLMDRGPAQAENTFTDALQRFPDSPLLLCYRIRQLAMLSRWEEIAEYRKRLDAISVTSAYRPLVFAFTKMQSLIWCKDYDAALELYENMPEELETDWDIKKNTLCAGMAHLAAVIKHRRGEDAGDLLLDAASCEQAESIVKENAEDYRQPQGERNGPWFFDTMAYLPVRLNAMFEPTLEKILSEPGEEGEDINAIVRNGVKPICVTVLRRWPHLPSILADMVRDGSEQARYWAAMFIGACDHAPFLDAIRDVISENTGTDKLREIYRKALIEFDIDTTR